MDRNTKIAFGVVGAIWLWGMYKQFKIYERVVSIDETVTALIEGIVQEEVDEKFEEIVDEHLRDVDGD